MTFFSASDVERFWPGVDPAEINREMEALVSDMSLRHRGKTPVDCRHYVVVQPGDTLWGLARLYLGDPTRWPHIAHQNQLQRFSDSLIHPGTVLEIPME